jgi:hypothetical protein
MEKWEKKAPISIAPDAILLKEPLRQSFCLTGTSDRHIGLNVKQ